MTGFCSKVSGKLGVFSKVNLWSRVHKAKKLVSSRSSVLRPFHKPHWHTFWVFFHKCPRFLWILKSNLSSYDKPDPNNVFKLCKILCDCGSWNRSKTLFKIQAFKDVERNYENVLKYCYGAVTGRVNNMNPKYFIRLR